MQISESTLYLLALEGDLSAAHALASMDIPSGVHVETFDGSPSFHYVEDDLTE